MKSVRLQLENGPEVEKEGGKTALPAATKAFLLKDSFTSNDVSMLENMDSACNTSFQDSLTLVKISLKAAGKALDRPTPANVAAYKGGQE